MTGPKINFFFFRHKGKIYSKVLQRLFTPPYPLTLPVTSCTLWERFTTLSWSKNFRSQRCRPMDTQRYFQDSGSCNFRKIRSQKISRITYVYSHRRRRKEALGHEGVSNRTSNINCKKWQTTNGWHRKMASEGEGWYRSTRPRRRDLKEVSVTGSRRWNRGVEVGEDSGRNTVSESLLVWFLRRRPGPLLCPSKQTHFPFIRSDRDFDSDTCDTFRNLLTQKQCPQKHYEHVNYSYEWRRRKRKKNKI